MKLGSERGETPLISMDSGLASLLIRLEELAISPGFRVQRQVALMRFLRPYVSVGLADVLAPLPEELRLADLFIYGDLFPEDGQPSLVEQVRDTISSHVSNEERDWLDPIRHSYMDLLGIVSMGTPPGEPSLVLRSLGDGQEYRVPGGAWSQDRTAGEILLTRLIRRGDAAVVPEVALAMSGTVGRAVFESANQTRREMEANMGTFALGDWTEFAKQHGYILAWKVAEARMKLLLLAEARTRFCRPDGQPLLYAVAIYEHHDSHRLADGLSRLEGWKAEQAELGGAEGGAHAIRSWVRSFRAQGRTGGEQEMVVARITLTPMHLIVECDHGETLNTLKHQVAATFGFSLHFRGETVEVPGHDYPEIDLLDEGVPSRLVEIPQEEELRLLRILLESVYLDWADRPNAALGGESPRHVARHDDKRAALDALIKGLEREDLAARRTGQTGYDYSRLRAHVGLA
ncbi:MAG: hypothetical protein HZB35_01740 [Nitrospirae bacterium]|nr:hypothetical protein [Nitrospirota bacterium]